MSDVEIGRHAEAIDTLKAEVGLLRADVGEIKQMIAAGRGGWRIMVTVGAAATFVGGLITSVATWLANHTA